MTPLERFSAKVTIDGAGCWLWTAGKTSGGYGKFKVDGRTVLAHRWHYETQRGPIPTGLQIDHLCRVRHRVNPDHLEPVTCRENLLRGATFQAANAAKTHCPQGHPYDMVFESWRGCRACKRAATAAWRAANLDKARQLDREGARRRRAVA